MLGNLTLDLFASNPHRNLPPFFFVFPFFCFHYTVKRPLYKKAVFAEIGAGGAGVPR